MHPKRRPRREVGGARGSAAAAHRADPQTGAEGGTGSMPLASMQPTAGRDIRCVAGRIAAADRDLPFLLPHTGAVGGPRRATRPKDPPTPTETAHGGLRIPPNNQSEPRRSVMAEADHRMLNILLVEDDEVDVMNVRRAFKKNNIRNPLWVAGNGLEGLEVLRGGEMPRERRLVLLDLNMPKMNGIEFLRELRADRELHLTPVVVLTTSDDERDRVEAYNLNVAGYVLKPVTLVNFVEAMATLNKYWSLVELP